MEFRCSNCQHVGPASEVRPSGSGVVLICENCGHQNELSLGDSAAASEPAQEPGVSSPSASGGAAAVASRMTFPAEGARPTEVDWVAEQTFERLVPERGEGPRCPKCARLVRPREVHCERCGLALAGAEAYEEGEEPWERPPQGREAEWERATLLWKSFEENPTPDNLDKFADFVCEEEVPELGVRRLRFYLADHPDDDRALEHLRKIAGAFKTRIITARARAQMNADQFADATIRAKQWLVWVNVVFWSVLLVFFFVVYFT